MSFYFDVFGTMVLASKIVLGLTLVLLDVLSAPLC